MARLTTKNKHLNIDPYEKGSTRTYSSDSWVTDSASSATAYSCGLKTYNQATGVNKDGKPCKTLLEAAKAQGYKVGMVVTSYITHATPAAFSSHVAKRTMYTEIASQQITKNIDVMLGGGLKHYLPTSQGGERTDGRNLVDEAREKHGYNYVDTRADLNNPQKAKLPLLGLFDKDHIRYEIDRKWNILEKVFGDKTPAPPPLSEMAKIATDLLLAACRRDANCPGIFIMIEGSRIDHAGHANDPGSCVGEAIEFDKTFGEAVSRARLLKNTLVVSVADHATGSLTLGANDSEGLRMFSWFPDVIHKQQISSRSMLNLLKEDRMSIVDAYKKYMNIDDLTAAEVGKLAKGVAEDDITAFGLPISNRAKLYWQYDGHDGADVPHHAYGPTSESYMGNIENIHISHKIAAYLRLRGVGGPLSEE